MDQYEGLDKARVEKLRAKYGYNEIPEIKQSIVIAYLKSFWGPLPWLMELLIIISFLSHQTIEGAVIAFLLVANSVIALYQHRSTDDAFTALTKKLSATARVKREGEWQTVEARELLPGDIIRVRVGNIVPADAVVERGDASIDLSSLTGESLPKEVTTDDQIFSGCVIQRGEVTARVTAIGGATSYGKTTQLLETSHPPTHMEKIIFSMIKYFFIMNFIMVLAVVVFGIAAHVAPVIMVNFAIVLLLTSVPISFPTMFTVAQSYGALQLSRDAENGVLVRRLAAVQECAMVDVFCSDKTGTLTQNKLKVEKIIAYGNYSTVDLMGAAAACSDRADGGPIDNAIFSYVAQLSVALPPYKNFTPFDFLTKHTESDVTLGTKNIHVLMGLPELLLSDDVEECKTAKADMARFSEEGLRVIAVVAQEGSHKTCMGLMALADPIKEDAPDIIKELNELGVRVIMITGDGRATAQAVARQLGLQGAVTTAAELKAHPILATESVVFAEAYPEDKLTIIKALQAAGHTVGMTGDGVNDAPALRQAEVGIAVFGATDVAKQAASFILTCSGLEGVVKAVKVSRGVYGRLRTWALNKIMKSIEVSLFTTVLFFITHSYIISPLLAVLILFANDFVTMAMATDNTGHINRPAKWNIGRFSVGAAIIALVPMTLLTAVYTVAALQHYSLDTSRTIIYLALIFFGKSNLYAIRAWPHAWKISPSKTLIAATLFSLLFSTIISLFGILISPVSVLVFGGIVLLTIINYFVIDVVKGTKTVTALLGI